ncbi:MAG: cation:proton antiporter [Candidatus Peregrinibacteria bacterium]
MDMAIVFLSALGISLLLNILLKKLHIEVILGYIFTGVMIASIFQFQYEGSQGKSLQTFAELGIALLMFTIGLEFSGDKIHDMRKEVLVYGSAQVLLTAALFFGIAFWGFGIEPLSSLIIGFGFSFSSTAIVLKLLNSNKSLHKMYGKNSLGILLFQDIAVIPLMVMIPLLGDPGVMGWSVIWNTGLNILALSFLFFVGGKYLITPLFRMVTETKSDEIFVAAVIFLVLGSAELAHFFEFSYSLGAFIAGLILSKTPFKYQIEADLIPFRDLLLGIFFLTVGMQLSISSLVENIGTVLLLLTGVIFIKILVVFCIIRVEYRHQISVKTAITLAQVGEFSFVVFQLAQEHNLFVDEKIGSLLLSVIVLSMLVTPIIFQNLQGIANFGFPHEEDLDIALKNILLKNHIIVCGYGALGQNIIGELEKQKIRYVGLEKDHTLVQLAHKNNHQVVMGNSAQKNILKKLGIEEARIVIIAIPNEEKMMRILHTIRSLSLTVPVIARALKPHQRAFLEEMGNVHIIDELRESTDSVLRFLRNPPTAHQGL